MNIKWSLFYHTYSQQQQEKTIFDEKGTDAIASAINPNPNKID